ncbi:Hypothetical_protein [Hexamita inflata]|uniref:Hypothetical_protein n=1 Tax=Hexamita inflata TaxID=28002 RepID=A0ABP1GWU2_9EUKA
MIQIPQRNQYTGANGTHQYRAAVSKFMEIWLPVLIQRIETLENELKIEKDTNKEGSVIHNPVLTAEEIKAYGKADLDANEQLNLEALDQMKQIQDLEQQIKELKNECKCKPHQTCTCEQCASPVSNCQCTCHVPQENVEEDV